MVVDAQSAPSRGRRVGRLSKASIALQVLLLVGISAALALGTIWFAKRPGLRLRMDWTSSGTNTLDEVTLDMLRSLEGTTEVDVFFLYHEAPEHFWPPMFEAHNQMVKLLQEAEQRAGDSLVITLHDPEEVVMAQARMQELSTINKRSVVISRGERRIVLDYLSDIAEIDPGNADPRQYRPATLTRFRGEAVFAEALAQLATQDAPRVLFTSGHAELDLAEAGPNGVTGLVGMLEAEGFEVGQWIGEEAGPIPEDVSVLAILGNEQPFTEIERQHIDQFVERGGRLFVTVGHALWSGPGSGADILAPFGVRVRQAIACMTRRGPTGGLIEGVAECGTFNVWNRELAQNHPITAPLVRGGRAVRFHQARVLERLDGMADQTLWDLCTAPSEAWGDLPDPATGAMNFALDQIREDLGPFRLAMATERFASGDEPAARAIGVATKALCWNLFLETNRDFLLNAFNWLAARESRLRIAPRETVVRRIDMERGEDYRKVQLFAWYGLPGVCAGLGLLTWFLRRRG